jgi:hypothetical protein
MARARAFPDQPVSPETECHPLSAPAVHVRQPVVRGHIANPGPGVAPPQIMHPRHPPLARNPIPARMLERKTDHLPRAFTTGIHLGQHQPLVREKERAPANLGVVTHHLRLLTPVLHEPGPELRPHGHRPQGQDPQHAPQQHNPAGHSPPPTAVSRGDHRHPVHDSRPELLNYHYIPAASTLRKSTAARRSGVSLGEERDVRSDRHAGSSALSARWPAHPGPLMNVDECEWLPGGGWSLIGQFRRGCRAQEVRRGSDNNLNPNNSACICGLPSLAPRHI